MTPLLTAAAVLLAVLLCLAWDRTRGAGRAGLVAAAVLSVVAAVAAQLNQITVAVPWPPAGSSSATGSRVVTVTVRGALTLRMAVYLPAGYDRGDLRYPVIEALHGYPGSPRSWLRMLSAQSYLDTEIAAGRMAPTVVLFPWQTPNTFHDTECVNLRGGPQAETFLTVDVPAYARAHLRVRTDRAGWALTGYSAGGFCAINLGLRHPGEYAAAAALTGYAAPGITVGDGSEDTTNNPGWRLTHLPPPDLALWLGWAADDRDAARDSRRLAAAARPPLLVTTAVLARGGHSSAVWREMEPPAFDWLSAHLARPVPGRLPASR